MSPFGLLLRNLRLRYGYTQAELALAMMYEQAYWSALELGIKGPPQPAFVQKLVEAIGLDSDSADALCQAIDDSSRHMTLPADSPEKLFRIFNEFRRQAATFHPVQLELFEQALILRDELKDRGLLQDQPQRIRRRRLQSSRKESAMT